MSPLAIIYLLGIPIFEWYAWKIFRRTDHPTKPVDYQPGYGMFWFLLWPLLILAHYGKLPGRI